MDKYSAIVLFGAPGVGKGTHGKLLAQDSSYFHFSSGEMFRSLDTSTDLGSKVKALTDKGNFVDDETTIALAKETLERKIRTKEYLSDNQYLLLDGLPRNSYQVGLMEEFIQVKQIIYLYVEKEDILVQRLQQRSLKENRRDDSKLEFIQHRLNIYEMNTLPLLRLYSPSIIVEINSSHSIAEVNAEIIDTILKR